MRFFEKNKTAIISLFTFILIFLSVSLSFSKTINGDEGFSLRWSMLPFEQFLERIKLDVCPFYLWLLRILLTITNNSLTAAKLLSVTAFACLLVYGVKFLEKQCGYKAMFFYGLFVTFTPTMLEKTVEVRTYALTYFLLVFACVQAYYIFISPEKRLHWILFTISSVAAAYTHYFAVLTLVIIYVGVFVFWAFTRNVKQIKNFFVCGIATVILYCPWVPIILKQTESSATSWIPRSTSRLQEMRGLFETSIPKSETVFIGLLAILAVIGVVLFIKYKSAQLYWALMCMSTVWGIWMFGLVFQEISRPIMVARYLTIPLSVTILGTSVICKYISKYLVGLCCGFFVVIGIVVYLATFEHEYNNYANKTIQFAKEYVENGDIIAYNNAGLSSVLAFYFPDAVQMDIDIYTDNYHYLWYFDSLQTVDLKRLEEKGIQYIDYGMFGFDDRFQIFYLYSE